MEKKEKIHIEYIFDKAGIASLWNYISTPSGLSEWFADDVTSDNQGYTFIWANHSSNAKIISVNPNNYIRFQWEEDESTDYYFEFRIHKTELTGAIMLEITDFAEKDEEDDIINLWETQVKTLKRILGL